MADMVAVLKDTFREMAEEVMKDVESRKGISFGEEWSEVLEDWVDKMFTIHNRRSQERGVV